jgi:choline dehydrogenase
MPRIVVVGAGSAGAVLAARLTERPGLEVVLLEAGPARWSAATASALHSPNPGRALRAGSEATWSGVTARRTRAQQPYHYWRGRGLGGTSAVNGQLALRPGPEELDRWPTGWGWDEVLAAFVRLEDDRQFADRPYHGTGGPLPIHRAPIEEWEPVDLALREAALAAGHPECPDHNAPTGTGVSPFAANRRDGRRISTAEGYLEPAVDRPGLRIVGDCLVDRVVVDPATGAATAVVASVAGGTPERIEADLVVLAAGAVHSPAILQRSGIGPADEVLRPLGIEVVADVPVGGSVMEHPIAYCVLRLEERARASSLDVRHTNVTVRYTSGLADGRRNDLMLIGNNLVGGDDAGRAAGIVGVALEESRSRGTVRITSADPNVDPAVELAMLDDEGDLVRLRDGARRMFALVRDPAIASIASSITAGRSTPIDDLADDAALDAWLRREVIDGNHAAASCPMGPVLDADCCVHGVDRLRVVDASSFPVIPAANPHLAVVMLAEVMADRLAAELLGGSNVEAQPARSPRIEGNSAASSRAR